MKLQIQIIRVGSNLWELHRVDEVRADVFDYEILGRVVRDGDIYYTEIPEWKDAGHAWHRQPKAYTVARAAYNAISDRMKKVS